MVCLLLLFLVALSPAQSLQKLVHQPPDGAGIGFLLTDGTLLDRHLDSADPTQFLALDRRLAFGRASQR